MCVNIIYCFSVLLLSAPGSVDVAVDSLDMGVEVEKWYPVTMESNKTNGGESSSIRLRFKYQVKLHRLPLHVVIFYKGLKRFRGRRGGHLVSVLDSGASDPGSSPGRGHCAVFLGKALYSHTASLHPGV